MTGPTEAAYEAAARAYAGNRQAGINAAVDAVWSLARTQVAAEIRAEAKREIEFKATRLWFELGEHQLETVAEWAARIAEGGGR